MGDIERLYQAVMLMAAQITSELTWWNAIYAFIGAALITWAGTRLFGLRGCVTLIGLVAAGFMGLIFMFFNVHDLGPRSEEIGRRYARQAIGEGVEMAQKAHATQLQYIHATVGYYNFDYLDCRQVKVHVNSYSSGTESNPDACAQAARQFTTVEDVDVHYVTVDDGEKCDSNGKNCHRESHQERRWNELYTPWFKRIVRYWFVADTKSKYLTEQYYGQKCFDDKAPAVTECAKDKDGVITDSRKPVIYVTGWMAQENTRKNNLFLSGARVGGFDDVVPEFWARIRNNASTGGDVVTASFIGNYFHWLTASESVSMTTYNAEFEKMKRANVAFPGPRGRSLQYTNSYKESETIKTDLVSVDGYFAYDYQPVTDLVGLPKPLFAALNRQALVFQGDFGPTKQGSIRWFIVDKSVVSALGNVTNVTAGLKAYLAAESTFGKFSLPKNALIEVVVVDKTKGYCIVQRDAETGMPFGNIPLPRTHRESIESGKCLPLDPGGMIGDFTGKYLQTNANALVKKYAPGMVVAGGVAAILYEETPGYKAPDPNSEECDKAPADNRGFIRYSMCNESYRQSNIPLSDKDQKFIISEYTAKVRGETPQTGQIVFMILGIIAIICEFGFELNSTGRRY